MGFYFCLCCFRRGFNASKPLLQPNKNQRLLSNTKDLKCFFNRHCVIISKARIIMLSKLSTLSLGLKASLVIK